MRSIILLGPLLATILLGACVGGSGTTAASVVPPPATQNTLTLTIDAGPPAAAGGAPVGAINHAYVTVKVCVPGSQTQCANIDHVVLDTGSWGLRLVRSVLTAGGVTLSPETDAQGRNIEECVHFSGGQTWGPVALVDVTMAGEAAAKLPVQIMDDSALVSATPAGCNASNLINDVMGFNANGVLGVGVFAQDCGAACVSGGASQIYYGCTSAGVCTAEASVALSAQVTNPVAMFAADNNGIIVNLPSLQNSNGEATVQGTLIFGLATQTDNELPAALTVLGASPTTGDFNSQYCGAAACTASMPLLPTLIDSGTDAYAFNDPSILGCASGQWVGYDCPAVPPLSVQAVNIGVGTNNASSTVSYAIENPDTKFLPNMAAYGDLAGVGSTTSSTWGMPFFYGRTVYVGIDQHAAGLYTGPFYAY